VKQSSRKVRRTSTAEVKQSGLKLRGTCGSPGGGRKNRSKGKKSIGSNSKGFDRGEEGGSTREGACSPWPIRKTKTRKGRSPNHESMATLSEG